MIDISIIQDILGAVLCPEYTKKELYIVEDETKRKGLSNLLVVKCRYYSFCHENYTTKTLTNSDKGMQPFGINMRCVYTMARCGVGHTGLEKLCGFMNMPPPMVRKLFDKLSNNICAASEKMAKNSMIDAAVHLKEMEGTDVGVSVDGTWQKRVFSSLNGVVAAVSASTGKVLDCEVLSRMF